MISSSLTRRERTKARTKRRLIAGARQLIGREGLEAVTIADVTAQADVGFGTFYGYFSSKQDLTREAVADALERLGRANDVLTAGLADPAEVLSVAVRHTLALVDSDPQWAMFMVRVAYSDERALWAGLHARVVRDLQRGKKQDRFHIGDPELVSHLLAGAVLSAMRARLDGHLAARTETEVVVTILAMVGVPVSEAAAIASRPLPSFDMKDGS